MWYATQMQTINIIPNPPRMFVRRLQLPLATRGLGDSNLGLIDDIEKFATAIKYTGIGVLALAAAVVVFKITDFVFGP